MSYRMPTRSTGCRQILTLLLSLFVVCAMVADIEGAVPNDTVIYDAIATARMINTQELSDYHSFPVDPNAPPVCPFARWHNQGEATNTTDIDIATMDLIDAQTILLNDGYTLAELAASNLETIFHAEPGATCYTQGSPGNGCEDKVWRAIHGRCNNLKHITWGSSGILQRRLMAPDYDDGYNSPRTQSVIYGTFLPNPRRVSNAVHIAGRYPDYSPKLNLHAFQMGQFLEHDMLETPMQTVMKDCCRRPVNYNYCMAIRVLWYRDPNPFFPPEYCMNVPRSRAKFCPDENGNFRREQINLLTSFIDGSSIYGSTNRVLQTLRGPNGLMKDVDEPAPYSNGSCSTDVNKSVFSTIEGTTFLNVVPGRTAYRTLFVREHNRVADLIRGSLPNDSYIVFQEARRIVIATLQKVVYDEFLTAFLPSGTVDRYRLTTNYSYEYENLTNPTISNEFGIAYRFGHTWIPKFMYHMDSDLYIDGTNSSFEQFNNTYFDGFDQSVDGYVSSVLNESAPATDRRIEAVARSFLFLDSYYDSYDIAAINIQRGRDHGIPSYTVYRSDCGLSGVTTFDGLVNHTADVRERLASVYASPQDIDLFTGLVTETPVDGGEIGPTLACLLGKQFRRLKFGDRYWFQGESVRLTTPQVDAIYPYSFAKLLCNNFPITHVNYPNAFLITDPLTACSDVPDLDLSPWTDF